MTPRDLPRYANLRRGDLMRPRGDTWRYLRGVMARVSWRDVREFGALMVIGGACVALMAWGA